jgi:hypothetical protein
MPKENINDIVIGDFRTEVSWRPASRFCRAGTATWTAPVDVCDCSGHRPGDVVVAPGHVQLATISKSSPFVHPANPADPEGEPATPHDGWRVTFDEKAIERTIDALMRAGTAAFPNWKRDWSTESPAPEASHG